MCTDSRGKIVVTGGGGGIGRAGAVRMAQGGAAVVILDIDRLAGEETVREIRAGGRTAHFIGADVTRPAEVERAFQQASDLLAGLGGLVHCVGVSGRVWGDGPVAECSEEAWDRVLDVNLKGFFLCCRQAVSRLVESGGGSIVSIASVLGIVGGDAEFATHAYAASKGGIISLTRAVAAYYAPQRIRANVICPGLIATPMSRRAQASPQIKERLEQLQPLSGTFGQPADVAGAIAYLMSDEASFVTGAVLTVDGGWTVR